MKQTLKIYGVTFDLYVFPAREARQNIGAALGGVEKFDAMFELPQVTGGIKEENGDMVTFYSDGMMIAAPAGHPPVVYCGTGFFGIATSTAARKEKFLVRAWAETSGQVFNLLQAAVERAMGSDR